MPHIFGGKIELVGKPLGFCEVTGGEAFNAFGMLGKVVGCQRGGGGSGIWFWRAVLGKKV